MQEALRLSRQQCVYANILWQDMLAAYGDTESSDYWRQRAQRRAYQGAVVYHLLQAGHCLAAAVLKQLADTRMLATANLSLTEILTLLQEQSFLSASAQVLKQALDDGHLAALQQAQVVFTEGATVAPAQASANAQIMTIDIVKSDSLDDPDQWPIGEWIRAQQSILDTVQAELEEC
jgi:hypothetical protein